MPDQSCFARLYTRWILHDMHRKWAPLFLMEMLITEGFILYPVQCSLVIWLCLMSPHSVCLAQIVHPVVPDPSDPQTHTNTHFTECVCVCPFPLVSQRKWTLGRKPLLAVSSVSLCAINTLKMFLLFLSLIQLECLSCYFHILSILFWKL